MHAIALHDESINGIPKCVSPEQTARRVMSVFRYFR